MIGKIDQPENFYLKYFAENKDKISGLSVPDWINDEETQEEIKEAEEEEDDFTYRRGYIDDFLVSELFVTRLGCEATIVKKDEDEVTITRNPRQARFNIHHNRRVADGLHLEDFDGETAEIDIPPFDIKSGLSPSLFLSLPDPMQEFKKYGNYFSKEKADFAKKPFTHLSKFIFVD